MKRDSKSDLYLIYEGQSEEKFLEKMNKMFESNYNIILKNAKCADNIVREYQTIKKKNTYSDIAVMYDLDGIKTIKDIISIFTQKNFAIKTKNIYFINPKFELIFILCKIGQTPIDKYEKYIEKIYGVMDYKKSEAQLTQIVSQISRSNITEMLDRIERLLSKDDNNIRSTNYDDLFKKLYIIM